MVENHEMNYKEEVQTFGQQLKITYIRGIKHRGLLIRKDPDILKINYCYHY